MTSKATKQFWLLINKHSGIFNIVDGKRSQCWVWTGSTDRNGYGRFNRVGLAHRFSWTIKYGPIPDGLNVLHKCDNPSCVRRSHLFTGTQKENIADAMKKGRMASGLRNGTYTHPERRPYGERNGRRKHPENTARGDRHGFRLHPEAVARGEASGASKLTWKLVRRMRFLYKVKGVKQRDLLNRFKISGGQMSRILHGHYWKEGDDE